MAITRKTGWKLLVWALLTLPAVLIIYRFMRDIISYGEVIHIAGQLSMALLFVTMIVTPLRCALPKSRFIKWLVYHRRALGVASFGYAALHTLVYLERKWGYGLILKEGLRPELLTGWVAMAIFLILAVTSNNRSVKTLKRGWQSLHRLVYPAAILAFAHWVLASYELLPGLAIAGALLVFQGLRLLKRRRV